MSAQFVAWRRIRCCASVRMMEFINSRQESICPVRQVHLLDVWRMFGIYYGICCRAPSRVQLLDVKCSTMHRIVTRQIGVVIADPREPRRRRETCK
jgi:hypothetical protein